jgi:hypothetical protein
MGKHGKRRGEDDPRPVQEVLAARARGDIVLVSRRDSLVRLLDTAIRMWFLGQDPLVIHLIVCAAYNCLSVLGRKSGKGPVMKPTVDPLKFSTVYDFLRHCSSDPNDSVDFSPLSNAFFLQDAIISYKRIFDQQTVFMHTFFMYFPLFVHHPSDPTLRQQHIEYFTALLPKGVQFADAERWTRPQFFDKFTKILAARSGIGFVTVYSL